jgi:hypothetical protein
MGGAEGCVGSAGACAEACGCNKAGAGGVEACIETGTEASGDAGAGAGIKEGRRRGLDALPSTRSASGARNTGRGAIGGVPAGDVGVPEAARGCASDRLVVPAGNRGDDGGKGTGTELVCSSRKSKAAQEGGAGSSEKGKEDSSKTTWREMITRLVCRSRQM